MDPRSGNATWSIATLFALILLVIPAIAQSNGFTTSYCSPQNTAGDLEPMSDRWQSNGWCTDACNKKGTFAFAVISYKKCWCSNYIPEQQEDNGECEATSCPGFPSEHCGNTDKNYLIYIDLGNKPSGTQKVDQPEETEASSKAPPPPPQSSSEPPSKQSSSQPPIEPPSSSEKEVAPPSSAPRSPVPPPQETRHETETVVQTITPSAPVVTETPSEPTTEPDPVFKTSVVTDVPETRTAVVVITESGRIVTQTIVNVPSPTAPAPAAETPERKSTNVGAIVGGVVGGIAAVGAIIGGVFFLLRRRRRQQQDQEYQSGVQRNTSTMSKHGLLRSENAPHYPSKIATSFNTRRSSRAMDPESVSPISGSDRRSTNLIYYDQRLNPDALVNLDNASRASLGTVDDSRDYHRPLNVRNPDPDPQ